MADEGSRADRRAERKSERQRKADLFSMEAAERVAEREARLAAKRAPAEAERARRLAARRAAPLRERAERLNEALLLRQRQAQLRLEQRSGVGSSGSVFSGTSHEVGRNSIVVLYPDRLERIKPRAYNSLSFAKQDVEMTPARAISSVQAKKDKGLNSTVTVYAAGNNINFRLYHDEAATFVEALQGLLLAPSSQVPIVTEIRLSSSAALPISVLRGLSLTPSSMRKDGIARATLRSITIRTPGLT